MTTFPTVRAVSKDAGVDRITVNGVDITWFRAEAGDTPTKVPGYTLTEPFAYGASQPLVIPRTNSLFEQYGTGSLAWLHKGARVQYQRTTDDGLVVDYRGFITAVRSSGREWVAEVAGELSGRANLIDKQPVLIRKVYDLGSLVGFACDTLGIHLSPHDGPETGLSMPNPGGMTLLSALQTYGAMSRTQTSNGRALMPDPWGGTTWKFNEKDTTTKDFTVFADGNRIQLDLVDDLTEQPNTIYGNGVDPNGERWRNSRYPGFFQGTPAPYPFDDDSDFGTGTTDGDTDTGDGITVMVKKLAWTGYLNDAHSSVTTYDVYVARAVLHLQEDAGIAATGIMNPETWLALWDADVVGFSVEGARIFPLAQEARIRSWNYSSAGSIIGRNPLHQPGSIRVDRTIDYGVIEKEDAIAHARSLIHATDGHQWAGTITLNDVSVFSGEHDDTDALDLTADDLMSARDIRPGMNAWLPYFDGGTLVHVSGVDVNDRTVTLTVSTSGLDVFDITQALQRNAESRRNVYREWSEQNRGVRPSNKMISSDEFFGRLYNAVELTGGSWNVVPIVMGQSGTVARSDIRLDTPTEFCFAVFDKKVTEATLNGFVGSPFTTDEDGRSVFEQDYLRNMIADRDLRIFEGDGDQPCGFFCYYGYDADGNRTANPLTGTVLSDNTWTYGTDPTGDPVVYLAIWPEADCVLNRGHLFYALPDDLT